MEHDEVSYLMTMMFLGIGDEDHSFDNDYDKELWEALRHRREELQQQQEDLHVWLNECYETVWRQILGDLREDRDAQPADMPGDRQEDVRQQAQGEGGASVREVQEEATGVPPAQDREELPSVQRLREVPPLKEATWSAGD